MMKRIPLIDDAFLRLESRRMPLHIGMLMLFEPPADATEDFAENIFTRLKEYTTTVPPFNQCLVRRKGMHYWEEDKDFDLEQHFVHLSLPEPGRIRELLSMVSRVHCGHLDRSYPLWRMYLIEGIEDGRIAIYLKIHHAMVDGVSGMKMLMSSMSTDAKMSTVMPPPWANSVKKSSTSQPLPVPTPTVGSISAVRSLARTGIKAGTKSVANIAKELRKSFNDFWHHNPDFALGGQAPRCLFNEKISGSRRFAAQSYSMPRIKAVAQAYGGSSNDVILAMCASALRRYLEVRGELPEAPLLAAVPVSVRREGHHSDAANEVAFTMAQLATDVSDPAERMRAIKSCMDYNKERINQLSPGELTAYAAMMLLPGATNTLLGYSPNKTLANVVISHVPGPRQDMYWQGAKLSGLYPASLIIDGGALNITIISRHDFVDFGIIACRKTVPQVQRLLDYLEDGLSELEATLKPKSTSPKAQAKSKPRVRKARATSASSANSAKEKPKTASTAQS
jgi:diacylglycerol O-acyltransferase / wax synthase